MCFLSRSLWNFASAGSGSPETPSGTVIWVNPLGTVSSVTPASAASALRTEEVRGTREGIGPALEGPPPGSENSLTMASAGVMPMIVRSPYQAYEVEPTSLPFIDTGEPDIP